MYIRNMPIYRDVQRFTIKEKKKYKRQDNNRNAKN